MYNLQNKKVAILGLGIENYALIKFLSANNIKCAITVCDFRSAADLGKKYKSLSRQNISWRLGADANQELDKFDVLFRSPGWPIFCSGIRKAIKRGAKLNSPMRLFFTLCPAKNIIGVTGTKGKGTTASLIYSILKAAGKKVFLGGNIGVAPFAFIDKIKKNDWVVLELSSFQLEDMEISPRIAVITNFSKEHLAPADPYNPNYHHSTRAYWRAKSRIFSFQKADDKLIINNKLLTKNIKTKSKIITFTKLNLSSKLIGEHNKENIAAAAEAAKIAGVKNEIIKKAIKNFSGLEHRLEVVREYQGVKYYNDTFATTPEAAITALKSFKAPIILLAGGADKGSDFKKLAKEIKKRVKFLVLFKGKATSRIKKELIKVGFVKSKTRLVRNMPDAIAIAGKNSTAGDVVLLSPACASFGVFKNYKERGNLFKAGVKNL